MIRKIKPHHGPLNIDLAIKPGDKKGVLMTKFIMDAIKPLKGRYAINFTPVAMSDITLPKLYLDDQLCAVGHIRFPEIVGIIDRVIYTKKKMMKDTIDHYNNLKTIFGWWIVYSTPKFKDRRTEILVPSKNVEIGEKNFRADIKIKREGLPNTKPVRSGIYSRYQAIYDFRRDDNITADKFAFTKSGGVQQIW